MCYFHSFSVKHHFSTMNCWNQRDGWSWNIVTTTSAPGQMFTFTKVRKLSFAFLNPTIKRQIWITTMKIRSRMYWREIIIYCVIFRNYQIIVLSVCETVDRILFKVTTLHANSTHLRITHKLHTKQKIPHNAWNSTHIGNTVCFTTSTL